MMAGWLQNGVASLAVPGVPDNDGRR
jgi:hypothetical protein